MRVRLVCVIACLAVAAAASAQPAGPCAPGEPTRLRLDPPPARLRSGERFCFEPRADDAAGCPVPEPRIRFRVEPPVEGAAGMIGRCFLAPALPDDASRAYRIVARSGEARQAFSVEVAPLGLEPIEPITEARGQPSPSPAVALEHATSAVAHDASTPTSLVLALAVLVVSLPAALGFGWLARRRSLAELARPVPAHDLPLPPARSERPRAPEPPLVCPRCGARYALAMAFCSRDGARLRGP